MAKLKFFARDDQLVPAPGVSPNSGQLPMYVGRKFDAKLSGWPALSEPVEYDSESDAGQRLMLLTRRDAALWPADEATAAACGVHFVNVRNEGGVMVVGSAPSVKLAKAAE